MLNLVKLNSNFRTTEQYRKSLETEEKFRNWGIHECSFAVYLLIWEIFEMLAVCKLFKSLWNNSFLYDNVGEMFVIKNIK